MPSPTTRPDPAEHAWSARRRILAAAAILAATFVAFSPALRGEFIWDDDAHVTRPELRSAHGLYRIWFELNATQQYYPLLHTAFWVELNSGAMTRCPITSPTSCSTPSRPCW